MNPKNLITIVLSAFVAVSMVVLAVKEIMRKEPFASESGKAQVVVYYFHGNARCPDCENIERYAQEAVALGFPKELNDGQIEWRVVNYNLPENEHFRNDYELVAPSVVLVRRGTQSYENLAEVWPLVKQGKSDFIRYIQTQLRLFLAQEPSGEKQEAK